jgi:hypothetical protein
MNFNALCFEKVSQVNIWRKQLVSFQARALDIEEPIIQK